MKREVKTVYLLVEADVETGVGLLRMKPELPKNGKWTEIYVTLSTQLIGRIKAKRYKETNGLPYVGTRFTSTLKSPVFASNPFRLIKFIGKDGSDIPENYHLELVSYMFTPFTEISTALGQKVRFIQEWKEEHPLDYLRFKVEETSKMMKDLKVNIVLP